MCYVLMMTLFCPRLWTDLGRMYNLVSRITDGLGELKKLLETHIHNQGLAAIEKCGEAALNVRRAPGPDAILIQAAAQHLKCSCASVTSQVGGSNWM